MFDRESFKIFDECLCFKWVVVKEDEKVDVHIPEDFCISL